ncbi:MFS transporter, partial [Rhizobium johnstonii]
YVLGYGGFLLLGGRVADVFCHRLVFLWSLAIFAAASIAGGFVDIGPTLIAARLIKGIAAVPESIGRCMAQLHGLML